MKNKATRQHIYAALLALGASILLSRTIIMIAQGALHMQALWVSILLVLEMLIDLCCFLTAIPWLIRGERSRARIPLRLGAAAAILHAIRVLVFVLGRTGPWVNFDVRPEQVDARAGTWTWTGVWFAGIMSILGVTGVVIIWYLIRRANKSQSGHHPSGRETISRY